MLLRAEPGPARPRFTSTTIKGPFIEQFTAPGWLSRWKTSEATKIVTTEKPGEDENAEKVQEHLEFKFNGNWSVEEPTVYPGLEGDKGLVVKSPATHHAIASLFPHIIDPKDKTLVIQYEVKFQNLLECGGAYIKLITKQNKPFDPHLFDDKSPYTIMFGPDKCGFTNKIHFIFRHKHPITGKYEEKHLRKPPPATISKLSTLYTLVVRPDNEFVIYVNQEKVSSGNLLKDMDPPVNPPKEIEDKNDVKPVDWVDEAKIPDPAATRPDDWDEAAPMYIEDMDAERPDDWLENEPLFVKDPESVKPDNWNDEDDGDWVPKEIPNPVCANVSGCGVWKRPMKRNPDYKVKWFPPMIDNPAYKGPWTRQIILNPNYYEDKDEHPHNFEPMVAVGFELWTMQSDILFDNIYVGHSEEDAAEFARTTWAVKYAIEKPQQETTEGKDRTDDEYRPAEGGLVSGFLDTVVRQVIRVTGDLKEDPVKGAQKHASVLVGALAGAIFVLIAFKKVLSAGRGRAKKTVDDAQVGMRKKLDTAEPNVTTVSSNDKKTIEAKENKADSANASTPKVRARKE